MDCAATISGRHVFAARGPKRRGGIRTCLCGLAEPRIERHIPTVSELHAGEYACACRGDLQLCERLYLAGDLRIVTTSLIYTESNHTLLRAEYERVRERLGRSAQRILELRSRHADLTERLREADDLTA